MDVLGLPWPRGLAEEAESRGIGGPTADPLHFEVSSPTTMQSRINAWPVVPRWIGWFVSALVGANAWFFSIPVALAVVVTWAGTLLSSVGVTSPTFQLPTDLSHLAKPVTALLAIGVGFYAAGRVGWKEHERSSTLSAPNLDLRDPEVAQFTGPGGIHPRTWWRVPIKNRGATADITVRLTNTDPKVPMKAPGGILHRTGDNPPDGLSFQTQYRLAREETQPYDLVSVVQTWKQKWKETPIQSTATPSEVIVSGSVPTVPQYAGTEPYYVYYVHVIETEGYSEFVSLDGAYTFTVTVYAADRYWSRDYRVEAEASKGKLTVT